MKKIIYLLTLIMFSFIAQAQEERAKFNNKFDDAFEEEDNQNLTLRFFNALTGDPIEGASVTIQDMEKITTDEEGKVRFPVPDDDGFLQVHFECAKYITGDFNVEVIAGTLFYNRISVSPMLDLKDVRIVLDWDVAPGDLDAHFMKENGYHISYRNTKVLLDGRGELDRDDMDGYGPETITVRDIDDLGTYDFFVHDFSNKANATSSALSRSKAHVQVYGEGRLLYVFEVPQGSKGTKWAVFQIKEGQFIETNQIF
jgi:hypothetical protein